MVASRRRDDALGASSIRAYRLVSNLHLVRLPAGISVKEAVRAYRRDPDVLYAEPDYVVHATDLPDDPRFSEQWSLHNTGQTSGTVGADIHAPEAWSITQGSSDNVVAVIDSGIDYQHSDLAANVWSAPTDFSVTLGTTNLTCPAGSHGLNAQADTCDPMDDNVSSHGTHVAGTIGAVGNNGLGATGVNWRVQLMACKFLDSTGHGYLSGALECLDFVKTMKDAGVNIIATNNSWGGGELSRALLDAIQAQQQRGILFIASAGNYGAITSGGDNDTAPDYPSSCYLPGVISVANTTRTDALSASSNYGKHSVHLGAPGSEILSTLRGEGYGLMSGTSMATPHVTGVAALLKAQDPSRDWRAIKNLILAGGDDLAGLAAKTVTGKRLNAYGSLACADAVVMSRLRPDLDLVAAVVGSPLDFAALHINCDSPNGNLPVTVDPGGDTVMLTDDGTDPDQVAGDGIYSGRWIPSAIGTFTLGFPGSDSLVAQVLDNYTWLPGDYSYRTITGTNLNLGDEGDPLVSTPITSPFPIRFGGGSFTTLFVSSNGTIGFVDDFSSLFTSSIPTADASTLVAPFWDDLCPLPGTDQNVFWEVLGTAPDRELVIEWRDVRHSNCATESTATVTFQVVFPEGSSRMWFNYADTAFGGGCTSADGGATATVGVQVGPLVGSEYSHDGMAADGTTPRNLPSSTTIVWSRPPAAALSTANLSFGSQRIGTASAPQNVILSNTGGDFLHLTDVAVAGDFSLTGNNCGNELADGDSCTLEVTFTPVTAGVKAGTLTITDDAPGIPHLVMLSGTGIGPTATLTPASLAFGSALVGATSASQLITLRNDGEVTLSIAGISVSAGSDFALTANTCGASLAAGAQCSISVTFTPSVAGASTASVTVTDDAPGNPHVVQLSGTGTDFSVGVPTGSSATATVTAGGTANYTVAVTPQGGFNQTVSLACTGAPTAASCSVLSSPVAVNGADPATVAVRVTTTARTAGLPRGRFPFDLPAPYTPGGTLWILLFLGLVVWRKGGVGARRRMGLALTGALLSVSLWTACGGGGGGGASASPSRSGTPAGTYTLTVTATAGSLSRSTALTLKVD